MTTEAISIPVYNIEGQQVDTLNLNPRVFGAAVNKECVYQVVNAFRAGQRKGQAATKTRGEVSGGGRKPWKQKGTGRARAGSIRSPLWRHGGVVFGPHPRDFSYSVPQKLRCVALCSVLSAKVKEKNLIVLDSFALQTAKTKDAAKVFVNLKITDSALLLIDKANDPMQRAVRNLKNVDWNIANNTNTYEVLSHKKLVLTKDAVDDLVKRLKK